MGFTNVESIDTDIVLLRVFYEVLRLQISIVHAKDNVFSTDLVRVLAEMCAEKFDQSIYAGRDYLEEKRSCDIADQIPKHTAEKFSIKVQQCESCTFLH